MVEVSAAVIAQNGHYLICRRAKDGNCAGLWEFPGGKREAGETDEGCLRRECMEELGIDVSVGPLIDILEWVYPDRVLRLSFFWASIQAGVPECRVHEEFRWVDKRQLSTFSFCPADTRIVDALLAET